MNIKEDKKKRRKISVSTIVIFLIFISTNIANASANISTENFGTNVTNLNNTSYDISNNVSNGNKEIYVKEGFAIIPYLDTGYKFKVVPFDNGHGFEQPNFDDSEFSIGNAGFGTQLGGCSLNNPMDAQTPWELNTDILLRKEFYLPPGSKNLKVFVAIDNDVQIFINGIDVSGGLKIHGGCAVRDSFIFNVPDNILRTGATNLIAVRGRDRGVLSYIDVKVMADSITVLSPNGGENWLRGSSHDIRWTGSGIGPTVKIQLYKGGIPIDWDLISSTPNDGVWSWPISLQRPIGTDYKVKIIACKGTSSGCDTPLTYVEDMSDNNFAISGGVGTPSIRVISPNGGENWARGKTKLITWTKTGNPGANVRIQLYKGSIPIKTISSSTPNDGSFGWSIPWTLAIRSDYKIKITSTSNSAYNDWSNGNFRIS